jgi:hypothetical protein
MRHHFRRPQAMFNKGSLFYIHCAADGAFHAALSPEATPFYGED